MLKKTGIVDVNGEMIYEGQHVIFENDDPIKILIVVWVGDGDDMNWAADNLDGTPNAWLDSSCKILQNNP